MNANVFFLMVIGVTTWKTTISTDISYGVDCSFPVHHKKFSCGSLLGDRQPLYQKYLDGCAQKYGSICYAYEELRLFSTSMYPEQTKNYTQNGFVLSALPRRLKEGLEAFWKTELGTGIKNEIHPQGAVETNHWESPTYLVDLENHQPQDGLVDSTLAHKLLQSVKQQLEEWAGMAMIPNEQSHPFRIRVYTKGAMVAPHIIVSPHVSFRAIIMVDKDTVEPWPIELYKRDGFAVNVTLEKGMILLLESGTVIHGSPFPLPGKFVATLSFDFLANETAKHTHYQTPYDMNDKEGRRNHSPAGVPSFDTYEPRQPTLNSENHIDLKGIPARPIKAFNQSKQQTSPDSHYNTSDHQKYDKESIATAAEFRLAAARGDLKTVRNLVSISANHDILTASDENGWQPIHEASRSGHLDIVEFLVAEAQATNNNNSHDDFTNIINAITNHGHGWSPLTIALKHLNKDHPLIDYLISLGAMEHDGFKHIIRGREL